MCMSVSFNNLPFLLALKSWRANGVFTFYSLRMKHSSLSLLSFCLSPIDYGVLYFLSRFSKDGKSVFYNWKY